MITLKCYVKPKTDVIGRGVRKEARYVASGLSQKDGIDNDKTFASVASLELLCVLLSIAAKHKMSIT